MQMITKSELNQVGGYGVQIQMCDETYGIKPLYFVNAYTADYDIPTISCEYRNFPGPSSFIIFSNATPVNLHYWSYVGDGMLSCGKSREVCNFNVYT